MRLSALAGVPVAAFLLLTGFQPGALPYIPTAAFSDAAISHWPAALHLRESVRERGEFPLWNDTILSGQPFAANPLNKTAYPLQWLVIFLPPAVHLDLLIVLHLLLAGWGMARWCRALGLRREAAVIGGLAYALAPRLIAHTGAGHLDVLYAAAWWPWLMAAVYRAIVVGRERRWLAILWTGLLAALVFLGDVRLSLFAFGTAAIYAVYEAVSHRAAARLLYFVPAMVLAVLLTASLWGPLLGWQPYLSRGAMTPGDAGVYSTEPGQFAGLLAVPAHGGSHETLTYLGLTVLILAVMGVAARPHRLAPWLVIVLLAALYALGPNGFLWPLLVRLVPALLWFRVPSRAWFVVVLVAPLLAAHGVDWLLFRLDTMRGTNAWRQAARARLFAAGGLVAVGVGGSFLILNVPVLAGMGVTLLVAAALFAVLLLALAGRVGRGPLVLFLIGVVFADLAWTGTGWLTWRGPEFWLEPHQPLADRLVELGAARVYTPFYDLRDTVVVSLPQEVAADRDLRLFGGVDPFQLSGIVAAVSQGSGVPAGAYDVVLPDFVPIDPARPVVPVPDTGVLAQWDVSHVVSLYPIDHPRLHEVEQVHDARIYVNLDHQPGQMNAFGWPVAGWPGLPDAETVAALNNRTLVSAAVSALTLVAVLAVLLVGSLLHGRSGSLKDSQKSDAQPV